MKVTRSLYLYHLCDRIARYKNALTTTENPASSNRLYRWLKRLEQSYNWITSNGEPSKGEITRLFGKDATYIKENPMEKAVITPIYEHLNYSITIQRERNGESDIYTVDFSTNLTRSEVDHMTAIDVITISPFTWIEIYQDESGDLWTTMTGDPYLYKTIKTPF